jgi:DNA-nicking Smr family endonuclease
MDNPAEVPIDGELDLHTFLPREIKFLVPDYLEACWERGIFHVRIVHGKGTGALRETVHGILEKRKDIQSFYLTDHNWGSTSVILKKDT